MTLKRCPFCGERPERNSYGYYHEGNESQEIKCENLECRVKPRISQEQSEYYDFNIIEEWNTRNE